MAYTDYLDTVEKIYVAYYQRPADPIGLVYWAERLDAAGGDLHQIIEAFAHSEESQNLYGEVNSDTISDVIDAIYEAAFNRTPSEEEKQYYIDGFNEGRFTPATIMLNILDGAQGNDKIVLDHKLESAMNFTKAIDPELDGRDLLATYEANDLDAARDFLKEVGATIDTVKTTEDAQSYIKEKIADPGDSILSEISGSTFTLTKDLDSITGTSGDDVIKAVIYPGGGDNNTWNTADSIDGKAGTDTIKAQVINEATKTVAGLSASNVEKVEFKHIDGDANNGTQIDIDVGDISGLKEVWVSNGSSYNTDNNTLTTDDTLKVSNISSGVKLGVANNDANLKVVADYANAATSGTSDEVNIVLGGGTTGEVDLGAGFEKVKIDVTDASTVNTMDLGNSVKEVDITGDKDVTIKDLTGFKTTSDYTVDASQVTGKVTLGLEANKHLTAKGGSGSDDVLTLDLHGNTVTSGMSISGFETLKLINTALAGNNTLKYSLIDGVDNLQIKGTTVDIHNSVITLKDVSAGTDVNFVGTGKDEAQYFNGLDYQLDHNTASDSVNLSVNNAGTSTNYTATIGNITPTGIENVTLDFADFSKVDVANFKDTALENLTIKGAADIDFNAVGKLNAVLVSVDASEASGDIDWGTFFDDNANVAGRGVVGYTFSKDLTFQGSSGADTISHNPVGTGTNTMDFNLGDGNDKFVLDDAPAASAQLKLDGGAGTDVFDFTAGTSATVAHFDNFEEIDLEKTNLLTLKVDDGYADKVKIVSLGATDKLTFQSTGGDVDLSHLTFVGWTASDTLTLQGSASAESLTGSSVADIIKGGKGADTITTGGGADKVVLDSPFDAADKITDFTSKTDGLYISLTKEASTGQVANSKVGSVNTLDAKWTTGGGNKGVFISNTGAGKIGTKSLAINGAVGAGSVSAKSVFYSAKSLAALINDTDKDGVGNKIGSISKITASASKTGMLLFFDTDDKQLHLVGLVAKETTNGAGGHDTKIDKVTVKFDKTIATLAQAPIATDIHIF